MTWPTFTTEEHRADYVAEKYAAAATLMQQHLPTEAMSYLQIATRYATPAEFQAAQALRLRVIDAHEAQRERVFQALTHDPVTPSHVGRKTRLRTYTVRALLVELEQATAVPVAAHGNGAHRRWFRTVKV